MRKLILLTFMVIVVSMDVQAAEGYEDLPEIKELIRILNNNSNKCLTKRNLRFCKKGIKPKSKGTGWCYMYVKIGLLKSGMTSKYIGGGSAKNAGPYLEKEGFTNILTKGNYTPLNIPKGSVLVYSKTFSPHGHIEVKIGEGKYASDYIRSQTNGELTGIYIKKIKKKDVLTEIFLQIPKEEEDGLATSINGQ
jgi:hypothetical protein